MEHYKNQDAIDKARITYIVTFPSDVREEEVVNMLRQISGSISSRSTFLSKRTIVFETWASDTEILHRLTMHWKDAEFIIPQLHGLVNGVGTEREEFGRPESKWKDAAEFVVKESYKPFNISNRASMADSIMHNFTNLQKGESAVWQWHITPINRPKRSFLNDLIGSPQPSDEDMAMEKAKFAEPNYKASFRVAANASTVERAQHIVHLISQPLASTERFRRSKMPTKVEWLTQSIAEAETPLFFTSQLNALEILPFLGWPIGSTHVPGLSRGAMRHLPPTESIPREGRRLGDSTLSGKERPIAMSHQAGTTHTAVFGGNGVGKTTLMANMAKQDMDAGHGVIVIEAKGDLFYEVLDYVPRDRLDDVVIIDFMNNLNPVGLNILDQGNPRTVIDELVELFQFKYNDKGVWFRELMYHGLMTLHEYPGMTFNDLSTLISPKDDDEVEWAKDIIKGVKDKEIKRFWHRWNALSDSDKHKHSEVVESRIWQIVGRIEPRYLFGQAESSFKAEDIIKNNKILLVNLAGVPKESAEIVGTLLLNALWGAAQRTPPEKANFLYMDEFQMFADLPMGFDDVLALARKFKLGMVVATQYVERLPSHLQQAIKANARTKVIFQSSAEGAAIWAREFGSKEIDASAITNLKAHMAIARINTDAGVSSPVTLRTKAPATKAGYALEAIKRSNGKYGRSVASIEAAEVARRQPRPSDESRRPAVRSRKLN